MRWKDPGGAGHLRAQHHDSACVLDDHRHRRPRRLPASASFSSPSHDHPIVSKPLVASHFRDQLHGDDKTLTRFVAQSYRPPERGRERHSAAEGRRTRSSMLWRQGRAVSASEHESEREQRVHRRHALCPGGGRVCHNAFLLTVTY
jgi:hypothetical protein